MTLSLVLPRFQQLGRQTAAGVYEMGSTVGNGQLDLVTAATISNEGNDPNGQSCEFLVIYNDQTISSLQPVFAVMKGDYELQSGKHTLTRTSVLYSSNSNGNVDFNSGVDNLRFIGVASHEHFRAIKNKEDDQRVLSEIEVFSGEDFIISITEPFPTYTATLTPRETNTRCEYTIRLDSRMAGFNSADDIRGRAFVQVENSAGVWVTSGISYFMGHTNMTAFSASPIIYSPTIMFGRLGASLRNSSGDFNVRVAAEVDFADNNIQLFSGQIVLREIS